MSAIKTVYLIGAGTGNPESLTVTAYHAIQNSSLLLGAARLLEPYQNLPIPQKPLALPREQAEEIRNSQAEIISVLLSGDPGFYSGAKLLYPLLEECRVITLPGISSVNEFCARLHTTWQDAALCSAHGRNCNVVGEVQTHRKCFFLTGGTRRGENICQELLQAGYGELTVHAGERLGYADERILSGTAEALSREHFQDLTVLLVENPAPIPKLATPFLRDEAFIRGKVPMTKEQVRLAAVAAMNLEEDSVVWDVGAGTGSVSVACALTARKGSVYAIEKKPEAISLIGENRRKFGVTNLYPVEGAAPEILSTLPAPNRVFIGGSSGSMDQIFASVLGKSSEATIVLTAVSLESLTDGLMCMKQYKLQHVSVAQLTAAHARELGSYHLMEGENPVWILSGQGPGGEV